MNSLCLMDFSLQKLKELRWLEGTDPEANRARMLRKAKWALSVSRNSMVVVTAAIVAYMVSDVYDNKTALTLTGYVRGGLPDWQLPWEFNLNSTEIDNNPLEMAEDFGIGLLMLPLVSIMQHLAIAKFYTRKNFSAPRQKIDSKKCLQTFISKNLVDQINFGQLCSVGPNF